ncbi:histidine phosphatase family protein [Noviherbaspirillum sp.]|uniref:histidine phosphatase family protein n=1 Tax=Noviherbaspirillum sp. TaxID=1926288 RepID=UPI002FDFE818
MVFTIWLKRGLMSLVPALLIGAAPVLHAAGDDAWASLKSGGRVVFIRHAVTDPGVGDPDGFVVGDCSTQRNLSSQGKADAKAIGDAFRSRGIPVSEVLTSRWCRCVDTAMLAFGRATPATMIDSMFNDREKSDEAKVREVSAYAAKFGKRANTGNLVLVTHAVNIQALTGISPATGEIVVTTFDAGKFKPVGRINLFAR